MTLRERLKTETMKEHHSIEGALPVFKDDFSKEKYATLLKKLHGFYKPLESQLDQISAPSKQTLNMDERRRLPRIQKDLTHLGVTAEELESIPSSPEVPRIQSLSSLAGALYVIEGSSLGGQLITKELKSKFGENEPAHYFNCYGAQTGQQWQAFVQWLGRAESESLNADEAIQTAKETFRCLNSWLKQ